MKLVALALLVAALPVAAITGGTPTPDFKVVGPGVQFTPNWVLTASHLGQGVGATYSNGWGSATIAARYTPTGPGFPQNDLTLLRLATPIDAPVIALEATVLPAGAVSPPIAATITTARNQVPRGYAFTFVQGVATSVTTDNNPNPQPVNWLLTHDGRYGGSHVQGMDSGGGLFVGHVTDATTALFGIASALVDNEPARGNVQSAFNQVAAYRSWIDRTMAADTADTQMATWVTSIPEPGTALLFGAGAAALLLRRRRQPPM